MNEQNYTSLELSKKLAENGCKLLSEERWIKLQDGWFLASKENIEKNLKKYRDMGQNMFAINAINKFYAESYTAYDILNDICVKYAKKFFRKANKNMIPHKYHTLNIFYLMQDNKKQEAENYILEKCLFNHNNKTL